MLIVIKNLDNHFFVLFLRILKEKFVCSLLISHVFLCLNYEPVTKLASEWSFPSVQSCVGLEGSTLTKRRWAELALVRTHGQMVAGMDLQGIWSIETLPTVLTGVLLLRVTGMCQHVIFEVRFPIKAFATNITLERLFCSVHHKMFGKIVLGDEDLVTVFTLELGQCVALVNLLYVLLQGGGHLEPLVTLVTGEPALITVHVHHMVLVRTGL